MFNTTVWVWALPVAIGSILLPLPMVGQIASPSNAGGNAGNNGTGSSISPISTPVFSAPVAVAPTVTGVSVETDGRITATPVTLSTVSASLTSSINGANSILSPIALGPSPSISTVNDRTAVNIVVSQSSGASRQANTISQLQQEVAPLLVMGESLAVSSLSTGNNGFMTPQNGSLVVSLGGVQRELSTTPANQQNLAAFAAIAIVAGMSPDSLSAGASLVGVGANPVQAAQLVLALQGIAGSTTITSLSNGIDAYNSLILGSSEATLQSLLSQGVFQAAASTLRSARAAIGP